MEIKSRLIRTVSLIILIFFSWTFGGLFDIAYALKVSDQRSAVSDQQRQREPGPEEKLIKKIQEMEDVLNDPVSNTCAKNEKLLERMAEMDEFDRDIKKKFRATERRLKEAGLSRKILNRHYDFVNKYEENLRELKLSIDAIGLAMTVKGEKEAIEIAKGKLRSINPPKKYRTIDPDRLPNRSLEPVFKKPRMNPGEFQMEMSALLLASNGIFKGLLNSDALNSENSELLLAASDPPTSDDLAETIEVRFTDAIIAKAAKLENNPVKIYNWVRNNIEFVPTYGSIQGADYCLQTKLCNAFDTASLLVALLRVSNIHTRYVEGTIEIPIEKVMNWLGGFTDKREALNLLQSGGIPTTGMTVAGEVAYARMEHVWVETWVDYFPSRGSRHKTGQGEVWIPLDASFKQYNYTQGMDIQSAVPFDAQTFMDQIQATATINETEGYVTDLDSLYINQTMTDYQTQVEDYINQNYPDATVGDVLGTKEIVSQEFPYLLGTLPYRMILRGTTYSDVPGVLRHKITFSVKKNIMDELSGTSLNITKSLPELVGKRITLSYSPATQEDEDVINSYLPEPHEDGSPIDPSELPTSLSAYLINLMPELRIDGEIAAAGSSVGMGATEDFTMTFTGPNTSADMITNDIQAGEYIGIGLDPGKISEGQMTAIKTKLEETKVKLEAEDFTDMTKDDILGDLLHTTAVSFFAELDVMDYVQARTMGVNAIRLPSETLFSFEMKVNKFMGMPLSVEAGGLAMDADRIMVLAKALDADKEKQKQFMLSSGMNSSALEHSVPEQLFSTLDNPAEGISAVKALKIANDQGIPIYTIDQSNIDAVLPLLQVDGGTIQDIQNAVHAGKTVTVSKTDISFNGWTGCGYIIIDPLTGEGAYMISGGMNGAIIQMHFGALLMFAGLTMTASTILAPMGILLFITGFASFIDGALQYFSSLTNQEEIFYICVLPAYIQSLLTIITMGIWGHLARPAFAFAMDYIGNLGTIKSVVDCVEDTF